MRVRVSVSARNSKVVMSASKVQVRIAELVAASMTGTGSTLKKELKSTPLRAGSARLAFPAAALRVLWALTMLEVSRSSTVKVPESVSWTPI